MISDAESRSPSTVTHYAIETHTPITKEMIA